MFVERDMKAIQRLPRFIYEFTLANFYLIYLGYRKQGLGAIVINKMSMKKKNKNNKYN
jgi:hypothetical protein